MKRIIALVCFFFAFTAQINTVHADEGEDEFYTDYIEDKLHIGTRLSYQYLTDSDSGAKGGTYGEGTFLGTIYALDEVQQPLPVNFFASYFFTNHLGVELAYDSVEAETMATSIGYDGIKSDGNVSMAGPTLSLVARYPNNSRFTPYLSIGLGYYFGDFEEEAHWALGYSDPSVYEALGSPHTNYNGKSRIMKVEDEIGIVMAAGCGYRLTEHFSLDLSVSYTSLETDATFYGYEYGILVTEQEGNFPVDNLAIRAGLTYTF